MNWSYLKVAFSKAGTGAGIQHVAVWSTGLKKAPRLSGLGRKGSCGCLVMSALSLRGCG